MKLKYLFLILAGITLIACNKETDEPADEEKILDYLTENNLPADRHDSGLYYHIQKAGSDERPEPTDSVTVRYKGMLLNGNVFDQTPGDTTVTFSIPNLIASWQIGIPLIGRGGEITLYSPSDLGYGNHSIGSIPGGSVLIFEVDLVYFK